MICCAIAIYLVSQLYLIAAATRAFLFGAPPPVVPNISSSWRLGNVSPAATVTMTGPKAAWPEIVFKISIRRVGAALALGSAALLVAFIFREPAAADANGWLGSMTFICRAAASSIRL